MKNTLLIAFLLLPVNHLLAQGDSLSGNWALRINQETGGKGTRTAYLKFKMKMEYTQLIFKEGQLKLILMANKY